MRVENALAILVFLCAASCGVRTQVESVSGSSGAQVGGALPIPSATGGAIITSGGIGSPTVVTTGAGGILAGGASSNGETTSAGGIHGGGASPSGGITANSSDVGVGCNGSFEGIQKYEGQDLCVAKSVWITAPNGIPDYQIDATEVTRGQYESWLDLDPALPPSDDTVCGWKATGGDAGASAEGYDEDSSCMTGSSVCQGPSCDHHPVVCVDWCDAYHYCAAVGKRLCGKIGGGPVAQSWGSSDNPDASQWYRACSSGGATKYPYGDEYERDYCNGYDYWSRDSSKWTTLPVAALRMCQSSTPGFSGAYDLSGSVYEWEDSCVDRIKGEPNCSLRGGAFDSWSHSGYAGAYPVRLDCGVGSDPRDSVGNDVGFRCCSP